MKDLKGKTAIVTGGGGGIGGAVSRRFAQEGAQVAVFDMNMQSAQKVAEGIVAAGGVAMAFQCDITDRDQVDAALAAAESKLGPIDILVNNAGWDIFKPFTKTVPAEWDKLIASADTLSGNEALAVADSLKASFQAGRSSVRQLGALAKKLVRNPDSHAFDSAIDGLEALRAAGLFDDKAQAAYSRFVAKLYRPELAKLGLDLKAGAYAGEDAERVLRRAVTVSAIGGVARDPAIRKQMAGAAKAFLAGEADLKEFAGEADTRIVNAARAHAIFYDAQPGLHDSFTRTETLNPS